MESNNGFNSSYSSAEIEERLKQGYYKDVMKQGVVDGTFSSENEITKEVADGKFAKLLKDDGSSGGGGRKYIEVPYIKDKDFSEFLEEFWGRLSQESLDKIMTDIRWSAGEDIYNFFSELCLDKLKNNLAADLCFYTIIKAGDTKSSLYIDVSLCAGDSSSINMGIIFYIPNVNKGKERKYYMTLDFNDSVTMASYDYSGVFVGYQ